MSDAHADPTFVSPALLYHQVVYSADDYDSFGFPNLLKNDLPFDEIPRPVINAFWPRMSERSSLFGILFEVSADKERTTILAVLLST